MGLHSLVYSRSAWLSRPWRLTSFNIAALCCCIAANAYFQVFCRPTPWATIVLAICFTSAALSSVLQRYDRWLPLLQFVNGVALLVFLYCMIFLEFLMVAGIVLIILFGIGLLAYVPMIFVGQLLYCGLWRPARLGTRRYFVVGITVGLIACAGAALSYEKALRDIEDFKASGYTELRRTFMTEKILGLGIRYHAELCLYDGWRPPLHEPLVNIGYWLHGKEDPLDVDLAHRVRLHRRFFSEVPRRLDCACAREYGERYTRDVRGWRRETYQTKSATRAQPPLLSGGRAARSDEHPEV